jgi:hypothetical protein
MTIFDGSFRLLSSEKAWLNVRGKIRAMLIISVVNFTSLSFLACF